MEHLPAARRDRSPDCHRLYFRRPEPGGDCDYLINYDIHWNPVRIIQRFGRIDRIGSRNPAIQLVNFWPTPNLDHYINLKHRVEARMALVDISATQEDNPLAIQQLDDLVDDEELRYRDRQLPAPQRRSARS